MAFVPPPDEITLPFWHRFRIRPRLEAERHWRLEDLQRFPEFYSPQLDNRRDVVVYLPPSYDLGTVRYPVLYMQDGQNLFDPKTSFAGAWMLDRAMERAKRHGVEAIVVGIANRGTERIDEYSPFPDPTHGGGRGLAYLRFVVDTLKPFIDERYRTRPEPAATGLAGSSMGGLISLYGFFHEPATFGVVGALSPSLWFADEAIFGAVESAPRVPGRIYLDIGTGENARALADARRMRHLLLRKGYRLGRDLSWVEERGAGHQEAAWSRRLGRALPFLFPA